MKTNTDAREIPDDPVTRLEALEARIARIIDDAPPRHHNTFKLIVGPLVSFVLGVALTGFLGYSKFTSEVTTRITEFDMKMQSMDNDQARTDRSIATLQGLGDQLAELNTRLVRNETRLETLLQEIRDEKTDERMRRAEK